MGTASDLKLISEGSTTLRSSGEVAVSTSDDFPNTLVTVVDAPPKFTHVVIINEGANPGFFSVDGGVVWSRIPGEFVQFLDNVRQMGNIMIKRPAGGPDMSGVYAYAW